MSPFWRKNSTWKSKIKEKIKYMFVPAWSRPVSGWETDKLTSSGQLNCCLGGVNDLMLHRTMFREEEHIVGCSSYRYWLTGKLISWLTGKQTVWFGDWLDIWKNKEERSTEGVVKWAYCKAASDFIVKWIWLMTNSVFLIHLWYILATCNHIWFVKHYIPSQCDHINIHFP